MFREASIIYDKDGFSRHSQLICHLKHSSFFPLQLTAANDDNYFVFEDTILQVKSNDTSLMASCWYK